MAHPLNEKISPSFDEIYNELYLDYFEDISRKSFPQVLSKSDQFKILIRVMAWAVARSYQQPLILKYLYDPDLVINDLLPRLADTLEFTYPIDYSTDELRILIKYLQKIRRSRATFDSIKKLIRILNITREEILSLGFDEYEAVEVEELEPGYLFIRYNHIEDWNFVKAMLQMVVPAGYKYYIESSTKTYDKKETLYRNRFDTLGAKEGITVENYTLLPTDFKATVTTENRAYDVSNVFTTTSTSENDLKQDLVNYLNQITYITYPTDDSEDENTEPVKTDDIKLEVYQEKNSKGLEVDTYILSYVNKEIHFLKQPGTLMVETRIQVTDNTTTKILSFSANYVDKNDEVTTLVYPFNVASIPYKRVGGDTIDAGNIEVDENGNRVYNYDYILDKLENYINTLPGLTEDEDMETHYKTDKVFLTNNFDYPETGTDVDGNQYTKFNISFYSAPNPLYLNGEKGDMVVSIGITKVRYVNTYEASSKAYLKNLS